MEKTIKISLYLETIQQIALPYGEDTVLSAAIPTCSSSSLMGFTRYKWRSLGEVFHPAKAGQIHQDNSHRPGVTSLHSSFSTWNLEGSGTLPAGRVIF